MSIYRSAAGARAVEQRYRELLARWPVPYEPLNVFTREGHTFVIAAGPEDAPPVLALHGSASNATMWLQQTQAWSQYLRVYAVDVIGEPGLSAPSRPALASSAYALWLDDVLTGLGLDQAAMVGMSLGGWLAIDYATRRPQRVSQLAVLAPSGVGRRKVGFLAAAGLLRPFGDWGLRRTMKLALGPAAPDMTAEFPLLIAKHFKPRMEPIPTFTDDALRRLTMPVLAVVGGRDALLDSHQTRERLTATVPHATVLLLPDTGHYLPDHATVVLEFLRSSSPTSHDA